MTASACAEYRNLIVSMLGDHFTCLVSKINYGVMSTLCRLLCHLQQKEQINLPALFSNFHHGDKNFAKLIVCFSFFAYDLYTEMQEHVCEMQQKRVGRGETFPYPIPGSFDWEKERTSKVPGINSQNGCSRYNRSSLPHQITSVKIHQVDLTWPLVGGDQKVKMMVVTA